MIGGIVLLLSLVVGLAEGHGSGSEDAPASSSAALLAASATPPSPGPTVTPKFHLSAATAPLPPGAPLSSDTASATASSGEIMVTRSYPFVWPATGPITSYMGSSHPLGIDIGLSYDADSPILATASGIVSFAGGDPCCSYGNYVIVDHGNGLSSLYGHLDQIKVQEGQPVEQGDLLGYGGNTGHSTGKHLHFEVRSSYGRLDPLEVLPADATPEQPTGLDCTSNSLVVDTGSRVSLDLTGLLQGGTLGGASIAPSPGTSASAPAVNVHGSVISMEAPIRVSSTPVDDAAFDLTLQLQHGADTSQVVCHVLLRTVVAQSHYYAPLPDSEVDASGSGSSVSAPPTATPTPSRTPILPATATPAPPTRTPRPSAPSRAATPSHADASRSQIAWLRLQSRRFQDGLGDV